jgi:opacity protein-like surface antigen
MLRRLGCLAAIAFAFPLTVRGQDGARGYFAVKIGAATPQHDDLRGFDTGLSLQADAGVRLTENLALEGSIGWFQMSGSETFVEAGIPVVVRADVSAIPVTGSFKLILPAGSLEVFGLVGAGMYFVSSSGTATAIGFQQASTSDSASAFGLHFGAGVGGRITPQVSLGGELRYVKATVHIFDSNNGMDTLLVQGFLGYRF